MYFIIWIIVTRHNESEMQWKSYNENGRKTKLYIDKSRVNLSNVASNFGYDNEYIVHYVYV